MHQQTRSNLNSIADGNIQRGQRTCQKASYSHRIAFWKGLNHHNLGITIWSRERLDWPAIEWPYDFQIYKAQWENCKFRERPWKCKGGDHQCLGVLHVYSRQIRYQLKIRHQGLSPYWVIGKKKEKDKSQKDMKVRIQRKTSIIKNSNSIYLK